MREERMEMELKTMLDNLADAGCGKQNADIAEKLYKSGQTELECEFKCWVI